MKRTPHEEGQAPHEEDHHEDEIQHISAHHSVGYAEQQIISCLGNNKETENNLIL
jgi:hypothetical protein